jgi:ferredoxin-NADP reductase
MNVSSQHPSQTQLQTTQPEPSRLQPFTAKLSERFVLNEKFIQLRLELTQPNRLYFRAGQYVLLTVPTTPQKKSYSICSAPAMDHAIEMLVDISPQGHGTKYLSAIQPGEVVQFMAPVGQFVIAAPDTPVGANEKSLVFIATGSGIAPFKGILEDLLITQNDQRPMVLYWGLRHAQDQFWFNEFTQLAQQHANFTFHPVLSQAPVNWHLCRGRVTDCLLVHPLPQDQVGYYLCGNSAMITDVKALLETKHVPLQHIHHEKFY